MEKLIIPYRITRTYIAKHNSWVFLYGNDLANRGALGQAAFASGEPNAFMIPTCKRLCPSASNKYFTDIEYEGYKQILNVYIQMIPEGFPIIPFPKIGEGCSQLKYLAPQCFRYMQGEISRIAYPMLTIDFQSYDTLT